MQKNEAIIYTPTKVPKPKKGRGFSLKEIKDAGLNPQEAKKLKLTIDIRRKTSHAENVEALKEKSGTATPPTKVKRAGKTVKKKTRRSKPTSRLKSDKRKLE